MFGSDVYRLQKCLDTPRGLGKSPLHCKYYRFYDIVTDFIDAPNELYCVLLRFKNTVNVTDLNNPSLKELPKYILAFRGTVGPLLRSANWEVDLEANLIDYSMKPSDKGIQVHKGFHERSMELFLEISTYLNQHDILGDMIKYNEEFMIVGHSLGAGLAVLFAFKFLQEFIALQITAAVSAGQKQTLNLVKVVGLAEPNVGNHKFYQRLLKMLNDGMNDDTTLNHKNSYNHVHIFVKGDVVPYGATFFDKRYCHTAEGIVMKFSKTRFAKMNLPGTSISVVNYHDHRYLKKYAPNAMRAICYGWVAEADKPTTQKEIDMHEMFLYQEKGYKRLHLPAHYGKGSQQSFQPRKYTFITNENSLEIALNVRKPTKAQIDTEADSDSGPVFDDDYGVVDDDDRLSVEEFHANQLPDIEHAVAIRDNLYEYAEVKISSEETTPEELQRFRGALNSTAVQLEKFVQRLDAKLKAMPVNAATPVGSDTGGR